MASTPYGGAIGAAQQSMSSLNIAFDKPETEAAFLKAMSSAPNQVAAPGFTDEMQVALARLAQVIGLTCNDAETLRERLWGSWPVANEASGSKEPQAPGSAAVLLAAVRNITDHAERLNETVQVLNARI